MVDSRVSYRRSKRMGVPNPKNAFRRSQEQGAASFCQVLAICSCALLLCGLGTATAAAPVNLYAVIVGITKFQDSGVPPLTLSAKDAKDFCSFLKEREKLFGKMELELLLNEKATRANITKALRGKLQSSEKQDIVIIYLSGHGAVFNPHGNRSQDKKEDDEFYFVTHDARTDNLFGTALRMNDENLFKGIRSERCLLLTDACHAGGFNIGLGKNIPKSVDPIQNLFHGLQGRIGIASSSPNELSFEKPMFGNSVFTHFLLKGLRGEAVRGSKESVVRAKQLYDYVAKSTREATAGQQNPQMYAAGGSSLDSPVFVVPQFTSSLNIKVQFQYEDESGKVHTLEEGSVLKSGQHLGVGFNADTDCFLYLLWSDSSGNIGQLFPNPRLTEGTGEIRAGETYWLPSMGGERWYVLDDSPGEETVFVVASRKRNKKLEEMSRAIASLGETSKDLGERRHLSNEIVREINLMGIASRTAPKTSEKTEGSDRRELFESMESSIRLSGAECFHKVTFKHVNR